MDKYFLISEHEYEGVMMTTNTVTRIQEFKSENACDNEIEKIKINNEQEFYKINILKVIKGEEVKLDE